MFASGQEEPGKPDLDRMQGNRLGLFAGVAQALAQEGYRGLRDAGFVSIKLLSRICAKVMTSTRVKRSRRPNGRPHQGMRSRQKPRPHSHA